MVQVLRRVSDFAMLCKAESTFSLCRLQVRFSDGLLLVEASRVSSNVEREITSHLQEYCRRRFDDLSTTPDRDRMIQLLLHANSFQHPILRGSLRWMSFQLLHNHYRVFFRSFGTWGSFLLLFWPPFSLRRLVPVYMIHICLDWDMIWPDMLWCVLTSQRQTFLRYYELMRFATIINMDFWERPYLRDSSIS